MEKKPYAVVYFATEDMYSEIPTSWLLNNESCYWPKSLNARKLMQKGVEPDTSNWDVHQLSIEAYSATLDGARKKALDSEYSTSSKGWQDTGRGRRKKIPSAWVQDNASSTDDEDEQRMTPPPTPKYIPVGTPLPVASQERECVGRNEGNSTNFAVVAEAVILSGVQNETVCGNSNILHTERDKLKNPEAPTQSKRGFCEGETPTLSPSPRENNTDTNSNNMAAGTAITLESLYQEIVQLQTICLSNKKYLNAIFNKVNSMDFGYKTITSQDEALKNIPLKTLVEVQEFELLLDNDDNVSSLVSVWKLLGGRDAKDHLYRCLGRLFSNDLATQCSWYGQRGNFKVKDLKAIKILTESIIRWHTAMSESDIEKQAGEWFRLSRQRLQRETKKKDGQ